MRRLLVFPLLAVLGCAADTIGADTNDNDPSSQPTEEVGIAPLHAGCPTSGVTFGGCVTATLWPTPLGGKQTYFPPGATSFQTITTTGHTEFNPTTGITTRYVYVWLIENGDTVSAAYSMLRSDYNDFNAAVIADVRSNPIGNVGAWVMEGSGLNGTPKPSPHPSGIPWFPASFVTTILTMANEINVQYANVLAGTASVDYQVP